MVESRASSSSDIPRILFVDVSAHLGGAERSLDELIAAIVADKLADVAVATARRGIQFPCPTFTIPPVRPRRMSHPIAFMRSVAALFKARPAITEAATSFDPDVIVANGIAAALVLPRKRIAAKQSVWIVRDMPRAPWASFAARRSDVIAAISPPVAEACAEVLPRSLHGSIALLGNGIDIARFPFRPGKASKRLALGLPADATLVGMVANLVPWKRHDVFIDMAAKLRDLRDKAGRRLVWVVAGSDLFGEHEAYRRQLRGMVADAGLDDALVWIEDADGADVIPALDLLVHPALNEPFGRVICEAMASGTLVVARDSAGPATIISNGKTGFLARDDSAMASIVMRAIANPHVNEEMLTAARASVEAMHTSHHVAQRLMQICLTGR